MLFSAWVSGPKEPNDTARAHMGFHQTYLVHEIIYPMHQVTEQSGSISQVCFKLCSKARVLRVQTVPLGSVPRFVSGTVGPRIILKSVGSS